MGASMTTPHTPPAALLDVAAIEARAAAIADDSRYITLTPWVLEDDGEGDYIIAAPESAIDAVARIPRVEGSSIDAAFIVRAVNEAAGLASDVLALIVENERLRALAAQHAADVAAASRSTRESCAATLRARAECLRRYAYEATAKADATEYTHDASEVDACAAIVASVALAAPTGGGE